MFLKNLQYVLFFLMLSLSGNSSAQECKRIVSLAAFVTHNLYELGAQDRIAGCTKYCLTDAKDAIPVVADAVSVNVEKIVLLKPDIVIAGGLTHPRIIEGLEKMGIRTVHWNQPKNFDEICEQYMFLAEITGKKEQASQVVQKCKQRLAALHGQLPENSVPKVFMQVGSNPLFTALPDSFMHDYIIQAGGKNVADKLNNGMVSKEYVLLQNPDVILIVSMGIVENEEKQNWKKHNSVNASKTNKIFTLKDEICSPTPETFVNTVEEIAKMIR